MRKSLFSLLGAGLALVLVLQACGGTEPKPVPPTPDGGSYVICEGTDAGVCVQGEACVYVDIYDRALCASRCGTTPECGDPGLACCGANADAGVSGYCLPREVCIP